jgi:pimeloyl-ACP methyl ester carboxylesterase
MTAVLVHGVPETSAVWGPMTPHLTGSDVVSLALPGFGTPLRDRRHWWMLDDPDGAAARINEFWAGNE